MRSRIILTLAICASLGGISAGQTKTLSDTNQTRKCKKAGEFCVNRETSSGWCRVQGTTEAQVAPNFLGPFSSRAEATKSMCNAFDPASSDPIKCTAVVPYDACEKMGVQFKAAPVRKASATSKETEIQTAAAEVGRLAPGLARREVNALHEDRLTSDDFKLIRVSENGLCQADWDVTCEGVRTLRLSQGYEYCRHEVKTISQNNNAYWVPVRADKNSFSYKVFARGSQWPLDRWGSNITVNVVLTGITAGVNELVRKRNSCTNPGVFGRNAFGCIRHGGNILAAQKCLAGPGACDRNTDIIQLRCFTSPVEVRADREQCDGFGGIPGRGTSVVVPNSPQCK